MDRTSHRRVPKTACGIVPLATHEENVVGVTPQYAAACLLLISLLGVSPSIIPALRNHAWHLRAIMPIDSRFAQLSVNRLT